MRKRGRGQPLPIFRTLCIIAIASLVIGFVVQLAGLQPGLSNAFYGGGCILLAVGGVGWLITGFGL
jgi:hypothetical protein